MAKRIPNPHLVLIDKLNELAMVKRDIAEATAAYDAELEKILSPVQADIDVLDAQAGTTLAGLEALEETLETDIRLGVKALGQSVTGVAIQAILSPGRPHWNNDKLEGYAVDHPAILAFRTTGAPSVALRAVRDADLSQLEEL